MTRYPWPANAGPYRTVDNLRHPWVSSPVIPSAHEYHYFSESGCVGVPNMVPVEPIHAWGHAVERRQDHRVCERTGERWFWQRLKAFLNPKSKESSNDNINTRFLYRPLQPSDWKAFAYWSRPIVNGVPVRNAAPGLVPPGAIDPRYVFHSLRGPNGSPHPERWVPGLQHYSLPPRPAIWKAPQPDTPLPYPWECQLNPFLEHRPTGLPPLYFDIGRETGGIVFAEPENAVPLEEADRAQPATFPLLTHMHIAYVADDAASTFPWPTTVYNPDGITCQDVFEAIHNNFQSPINQVEYETWSERQKDRSTRAYQIRLDAANSWNPELSPPVHDGLRRIDYMGDRVMFRGLEPSPNRDVSWVMFVGPA